MRILKADYQIMYYCKRSIHFIAKFCYKVSLGCEYDELNPNEQKETNFAEFLNVREDKYNKLYFDKIISHFPYNIIENINDVFDF